MFIIWGSRSREKVLGHTGQTYQCGHCNNASRYKVFRRQRWFTLFWIPIFPFNSEYYVACPICNYGVKVPKEEAMKQVESGETQNSNEV